MLDIFVLSAMAWLAVAVVVCLVPWEILGFALKIGAVVGLVWFLRGYLL